MCISPSLPSDFVPDRGPAKYFHGRKQILRDLSKILRYSIQNKWGTTFLIQGAPGAGKSALLKECEKHATENEWNVAKIGTESFWDPYELREDIGLGNKSEVTEKSTQFGMENLLKREVRTSRPRRTILNILQADKQPLMLVLDEAQVLGEMDVPPSEYRATAIKVLDAIHNGKLNKPVILIAAGLGMTAKAFRSLGISRFEGESFVELGALGTESERAVIHDWLMKGGRAIGDPEEWIHAIAQETHGWPQHILSYIKPALKQLVADKRVMTPEGLNTVLERGRKLREAYYRNRMQGFPEEERQSLAMSFSNVPIGESTNYSAIMSSLTQDYSQGKAEELFHRAVEKGIIDERDGRYVVPIPSMQDWLVSNYAHIQIKSPPQTIELREIGGRDTGDEMER